MTKSQQARMVYNDDNSLSVSTIAKLLDMSYSACRAALLKVMREDTTSIQYVRSKRPLSRLKTAVEDRSIPSIRNWLKKNATTIDWYETFADDQITTITFSKQGTLIITVLEMEMTKNKYQRVGLFDAFHLGLELKRINSDIGYIIEDANTTAIARFERIT